MIDEPVFKADPIPPPRPSAPTDEQSIHESLDNAKDNGYDPNDQTLEENVVDLMRMDARAEMMAEVDVRKYLTTWPGWKLMP